MFCGHCVVLCSFSVLALIKCVYQLIEYDVFIMMMMYFSFVECCLSVLI